MRSLAFFVAILTVACSASRAQFGSGAATSSSTTGAGGDADGGGGAAPSTSSGDGGAGGFDLSGAGGSTGTGPEPLEGEVYGHSSATLYRLDPLTKAVSVVGPFQGCSNVIDIAINATNEIVGTTFDGIYWINKATAGCKLIANGGYPNSLSFVPEGTIYPDKEALVGYQGSTYVLIDTTSGKVSTIGSVGGGYSSSGDIVSVKGGGTYLTVNGNNCSDCLIEVDPKTGALKKNWGSVGHSAVFGLAYWGGVAYGFSNAGELFEIHFQQSTVTTQLIAVPNPPPGLSFWGAGSSTIVPISVPE